MQRLINAFRNSLRAFGRLLATEKAFQEEIILLCAALPVAWFLADTWRGFALLVGAILLLLIVEVLNTGIEAACDAFSREFNTDIQLAKDCGSLAVLVSILLAGGVWVLAIAEKVAGVAL
jgi:diacylglycerol kinase (ATP)